MDGKGGVFWVSALLKPLALSLAGRRGHNTWPWCLSVLLAGSCMVDKSHHYPAISNVKLLESSHHTSSISISKGAFTRMTSGGASKRCGSAAKDPILTPSLSACVIFCNNKTWLMKMGSEKMQKKCWPLLEALPCTCEFPQHAVWFLYLSFSPQV